MSQTLPPELIILALKIQIHFSLEEMNQLCFSLSVEPEEIPGVTRSEKAREVILFFHRRNRIQELIDKLKAERPNVNFDEEVTIPIVTSGLTTERQRELHFLLDELNDTYDELLEWKEVHNRLDNLSNRVYGQYAKEVRNLYGKPISADIRLQLLDVWDRVVYEIKPFLEWVAETKYIGRSSPEHPSENEKWFRKIEIRYLVIVDCLGRISPSDNTGEQSHVFTFLRKNKKLAWNSWWAELDQLTRELGSELQSQLSRADDKLLQTANELGKKSGKAMGVRK